MRTGMTPPLRQDATPAPALKPTSWVVYLVLALIVLAGVLPFADRAFCLDEHIFLRLARSAQSNWLFPADTPVLFFGTRHADSASHTHPPVGEYFLAGIDWLMPEFNEAPYRILFAVFPIMAALAFYSVARRFARAPLMLTLLLIASPAFFVMSHTVMMDVPMLAFLLVGLALFLSHIDGSRGRLIPASISFILAAGIGYTALVPLGCLFFVGALPQEAVGRACGHRRGSYRTRDLAWGDDGALRPLPAGRHRELLPESAAIDVWKHPRYV